MLMPQPPSLFASALQLILRAYCIACRSRWERNIFAFEHPRRPAKVGATKSGGTMSILTAILLGIVAGLRAMTAPAVVSWAAYLGWINVSGTTFAFMGFSWTPWIFTLLAIAEIVNDKLPTTPSRKVPPQFIARVVMGALAGATLGAAIGGAGLVIGLIAGVVGAVIGTYGGAAVRGRLAGMFGRDLPAALVEDVVAVAGGLLVVWALRPVATVPAAAAIDAMLTVWGLA
jgi:uncharacterized membrane protein